MEPWNKASLGVHHDHYRAASKALARTFYIYFYIWSTFGSLELVRAGRLKSDLLVFNVIELQYHVRLPRKHFIKRKKKKLGSSKARHTFDNALLPKHSAGRERLP